jgi:hypothetical protein
VSGISINEQIHTHIIIAFKFNGINTKRERRRERRRVKEREKERES